MAAGKAPRPFQLFKKQRVRDLSVSVSLWQSHSSPDTRNFAAVSDNMSNIYHPKSTSSPLPSRGAVLPVFVLVVRCRSNVPFKMAGRKKESRFPERLKDRIDWLILRTNVRQRETRRGHFSTLTFPPLTLLF